MKKIRIVLVVMVLVITVFITANIIISGLEKSSSIGCMAASRYNCKAIELNGKILVFGGFANPKERIRRVEEYDPFTGKSSMKKAEMQTLAHCFSVAEANGKVYLVGSDEKGCMEEYDPQNDVCTIKKPSYLKRNDVGAVGFHGKVYVIGGVLNGRITGTVEEYDPLTDSWSRKSNMPTPRKGLSLVEFGDKIYAIGGTGENGGCNDLEVYDPVSDKWVKKAGMKYERTFFGAVASQDKIYVLGGQEDSGSVKFLNTVEEYDPSNDKWIQKDNMPYKLGCMGTALVNENIYVMGGLNLNRSIRALLFFQNIGADNILRYDYK